MDIEERELRELSIQAELFSEAKFAAEQFAIRGKVSAITQIHKGYINQTFLIETTEESVSEAAENSASAVLANVSTVATTAPAPPAAPAPALTAARPATSEAVHWHYTLQRINENVFPNMDDLMDNYCLTTEHLKNRLHLAGERNGISVQQVLKTREGRPYLRIESGCWRMLSFFDDVYSLDIPDSPETFYYTGRVFGGFLNAMADVDPNKIHEVISNFHNTRSRYRDLEASIFRNQSGRLNDVAKEVSFVRSRCALFGQITDAIEQKRIPLRICHNDCNLNNVLFDNETHLPAAVIDMDTVMPSSPLYDFGDSMRIGTNTARDDEKDLSKVSCDLGLFERYARGYLEECGVTLTRAELELLPLAALTITSEDGIRFLMDHIDGDTYYTIAYPGQNLDRARTQQALLADMERKLPEMVSILQ